MAKGRCENGGGDDAPQFNPELYAVRSPMHESAPDVQRSGRRSQPVLYVIFPNSKITRVTPGHPDLGPQFPFKAGVVMTVEFTLNGRVHALNGGAVHSARVSIAVLCETQAGWTVLGKFARRAAPGAQVDHRPLRRM